MQFIQRNMEKIRHKMRGLPGYLLLALFATLLFGFSAFMALSFKLVTVIDSGGGRHALLTTSLQPGEIVQMAGISTGLHDRIVYTESISGASIYVNRAFAVYLQADGSTSTNQVTHGTVKDLLAASKVQLGPDDFVEPALETPLDEGLYVRVYRVKYVQDIRQEQLSQQELQELAELGQQVATSFGGLYYVTYQDRIVNGLVAQSQVLAVAPITQRVDDDTPAAAFGARSRIEGFDDIQLGEDGMPLQYSKIMEEAVCTAYSSSGGRGASGLGLYCGTVAVDPSVIPYGTRLYIASADGQYVYGFAIATDTGTALVQGHVDIDLYFETNAECREFGKRLLRVYVLD